MERSDALSWLELILGILVVAVLFSAIWGGADIEAGVPSSCAQGCALSGGSDYTLRGEIDCVYAEGLLVDVYFTGSGESVHHCEIERDFEGAVQRTCQFTGGGDCAP
jgi:hypothetical protein